MTNVGINLIIAARDMTAAGFASARGRAHAFTSSVGGAGNAANVASGGMMAMAGAGLKMAGTLALAGAAVGGIYAIGSAIGSAVSAGSAFEAELDRVQAVSGATAEQMAGLESQALSLARATRYTAAQVADAQGFMAMAGMSVPEIQAALPGTLDLAAAGDMDVAQTADIQTNILRAFALEASEAGRVADVLAKAASSANTDVYGMGEAMKYAAPVARAAGVSLEEVAATVGVLSDQGIKADMAGTSIRGVLLSIADAGKQAKLRELGIEVVAEDGTMRSLPEILADMRARFGSGLQGVTGIGEIFDNRQAAAVAALMADSGAAVEALSDKLRNSAGTAADIAAKRMDNLRGDTLRLQSAFESLGVRLFTLANPMLRSVVGGVANAVNSVTGWIESFVQNNAALLIQWGQTTGAVFGIAWDIVSGFGSMVGAVFGFVGSLFGANTTQGQSWSDALVDSLIAVEFGLEHWKTVGALALVTIGYSFVTLGEQVRYILQDVIGGTIGWMVGNVWGNLNSLADGIGGFFTSLTGNIVRIATSIPDLIAGNVSIADLWEPVAADFQPIAITPLQIADRQEGELEAGMRRTMEGLQGELKGGFAAFYAERRAGLDEQGASLAQRFGAAGAEVPGGIGPVEGPDAGPALDSAGGVAAGGVAESASKAAAEVAKLPAFESSLTGTALARRFQEEQGNRGLTARTADATAATATNTAETNRLLTTAIASGPVLGPDPAAVEPPPPDLSPVPLGPALPPAIDRVATDTGNIAGILLSIRDRGLAGGPPVSAEPTTVERTDAISDLRTPLESMLAVLEKLLQIEIARSNTNPFDGGKLATSAFSE